MAVHDTPCSAGAVHEFALSPPMALQIHGSFARRMCRTFVVGLCCRSSCGSLLLRHSILHICSFAAVHSRWPPLSRCCSSATNHCCCPLTRLHHSVLPLVSCRCPLPHPTQVAHPPTWIWHLSLLRCHRRYTLFHCHTVVAPPPPSSLASHRLCPLRCCVVSPPLLLDSC
jgi:hypothetical protein